MRAKRGEPRALRQGKAYHEQLRQEWKARGAAQGEVKSEQPVTKPSGRGGRMDIFVRAGKDDSGQDLVAIVEFKNYDWDVKSPARVKRDIRALVRQVWSYVEPRLGADEAVCPGVVFPTRPRDPELVTFIEEECGGYGIAVAWHDESVEESLARSRSDGGPPGGAQDGPAGADARTTP